MSRNRGRTGGPRKRGSTTPPPAMTEPQEENGVSGLSFVVPTDFVELPSRGKFYPEDHPLHNEETIEIRHMTAKEEDILTSRALLKKGLALDRLIKNIIVDKKINPSSLLVGDRNAIIIAARVSGYGPKYETQVSCPACQATQNYSFDLQEYDVYEGNETDDFDLVSNNDGTFTVTLPATQLKVAFRLLSGMEEKSMLNGIENDRKRKVEEKNVTRLLSQILVAANNDTSEKTKRYVIENMPSLDSRHLRAAYKAACPNVDLTQFFECSECGQGTAMEVPLTADFFWPDR